MTETIHVLVLKFGIVDRAPNPLAQALSDIARGGDSSSPKGLLHMLGQTCELVHDMKPSWTHGYSQAQQHLSATEAETYFRGVQHAERQRFEQEIIANQQGHLKETTAPAVAATEETAMLVLTILGASRSAIASLAAPPTATDLEHALQSLQRWRHEDFVAVDVIWTPASPEERISVAEMENKHPELIPIQTST